MFTDKAFVWLFFSLYLIDPSRQAFSYKSKACVQSCDNLASTSGILSLHLFAFLSLNYHIIPTVTVKVKQLNVFRPLTATPEGGPVGITHGSYAVLQQ